MRKQKVKRPLKSAGLFGGMTALGIAMCAGLMRANTLGGRGPLYIAATDDATEAEPASKTSFKALKDAMEKCVGAMSDHEKTLNDDDADDAKKEAAQKSYDAQEAKYKKLEGQFIRAKNMAERRGQVELAGAMAKTVVPGSIPARGQLEAKNHDEDDRLQVEAFTDWFCNPAGAKLSDTMQDALAPKGKNWDCANAKGAVGNPMALPRPLAAKVMSFFLGKAQPLSSDQASPGNLYQAELMREVMMYAGEGAKLFPRCKRIPTSSGIVHYPRLVQTAPGAEGSGTEFGEYGGVAVAWTAEGADAPATEPTFDQVQYLTNPLMATTALTRQLIQRSVIDLPSLLQGLFNKAVGHKVDLAIIQGNGVGKPTGIIGAAGVPSVFRQVVNQVQFDDFTNLETSIPPDERDRMIYVIADGGLQYAKKLKDDNKRPLFLPSTAGAFSAGVADYGKINGHDVIPTQRLTLGAAGDIIAAVLDYYVMAVENEMVMMANPYTQMSKNAIQYFAFMQLGGKVHEPRLFATLDAAVS